MTNSIYRCAGNRRASVALAIGFAWFAACVLLTTAAASPAGVTLRAPDTGDPVRGQELFEKRCGGCHSLDADKEGPRLRNVYGRKAGSISTFQYSDALKRAQITWDESSLEKWLTDTESVVPGNDMDFHVPKADERTDIIEFLRASSGK
jgi:cytochrome c